MTSTEPRTWSLGKALSVAAVIVVLDGVLLSQGVLAYFAGAIALLVGVPRALMPRFASVRRASLRNSAIVAGASLVVMGIIAFNNRVADERAQAVVAAVHAFHAKEGRYPRRLEELVPVQLPAVPRASYAVMAGRFSYAWSDQDPRLHYIEGGAFGPRAYSFGTRRWFYD